MLRLSVDAAQGAFTKAFNTPVVLFFMHARWSERPVQVTVLTALAFLTILVAFTLQDYVTRDIFGVAGR